MTTTLTLDESGQINLPEALKRIFGARPGESVRAEVTEGRIEIVKDVPLVTEGVMENGVLVLPKLGVPVNAAAAVRADRDALVNRAQK